MCVVVLIIVCYSYTYRSEGIARTGYLIPGCDGIPGLDVAGNSSVAAAAVVVVVVVVVVALQAWTHQKKKDAIFEEKKPLRERPKPRQACKITKIT